MDITIKTKRPVTITVNPLWTGTNPGYQMAYLSIDQKRLLGLPISLEYAIRIDGTHAYLVRVINGYTAHKYDATMS